MIKPMYEEIFEGNSKEAEEKYPFLVKGLYCRVLNAFSKNIGVFPLEKSFYVVTYETKKDLIFKATIEETNSMSLLNTIIKRETYGDYYLDDEKISLVLDFLKENNCEDIIIK